MRNIKVVACVYTSSGDTGGRRSRTKVRILRKQLLLDHRWYSQLHGTRWLSTQPLSDPHSSQPFCRCFTLSPETIETVINDARDAFAKFTVINSEATYVYAHVHAIYMHMYKRNVGVKSESFQSNTFNFHTIRITTCRD